MWIERRHAKRTQALGVRKEDDLVSRLIEINSQILPPKKIKQKKARFYHLKINKKNHSISEETRCQHFWDTGMKSVESLEKSTME